MDVSGSGAFKKQSNGGGFQGVQYPKTAYNMVTTRYFDCGAPQVVGYENITGTGPTDGRSEKKKKKAKDIASPYELQMIEKKKVHTNDDEHPR